MATPENFRLVDTPPLRVGMYAAAAMSEQRQLLDDVDQGSREKFLTDIASSDAQLDWMKQGWSQIVRAMAADHYADAGFQAIAWPQGWLDAVQVLRALIEEHSNASNNDWQMQTTWATIDHLAPTGTFAVGMGDLSKEDAGLVLRMDDVLRELNKLTSQDWCGLTNQLGVLMPSAGIEVLAVATGALGCLVLGGRITHCEAVKLGGSPMDWQIEIKWLDSSVGQGPSGERLALS